VLNLSGGRFHLSSSDPRALARFSAPGYLPVYAGPGIPGSDIDEPIKLWPAGRGVRTGVRLTWTDFRSHTLQWLPDWDHLLLEEIPLRPGFIGFDLKTTADIWWKGLSIYNSQGVRIANLESERGRYVSRTHGLTFPVSSLQGGLIVLSKAKFLGIHTGMYEIPIDNDLTSIENGISLVFNWIHQ
jgi:hypothetical protein